MAAFAAMPTSPTGLIFGSQGQQLTEKKDDKGNGQMGKAEEQGNIQQKEFIWDQFFLYLATAIALLTILDITLQFFRGGGIFCYLPPDMVNGSGETTRDHAAYVNTFCLQSLSLSEYYPVFILIQGIFLAAPNYLWSAIFGGQFDFFFHLVKQLDRLRARETGEYQPKNFEIVKKLEKEFSENWKWVGIFPLYVGKLFLQLVLAVSSLIINAAVFPQSSFEFVFICPRDSDNPRGWSLPSTVECVYSSFRVLEKIQVANYVLLILAVFTVVYGLFWCCKRHKNALGYKDVALFAFSSSLKPEEFVFEPFWSSPFYPGIRNDLDFLLMRLYRADSGYGQVFKDIQVDKELKRRVGEDTELLHLMVDRIKHQDEMATKSKNARNEVRNRGRREDIRSAFLEAGFLAERDPEELAHDRMGGKEWMGNMQLERVAGIRDMIFGFMQWSPKPNEIAYDISFGTIGYSLILGRAFQEAVSVNFHPFYRNEKEIRKKESFHASHSIITYQDNIFTQKSDNIVASDEPVDEVFRTPLGQPGLRKMQFMVVGPFTDKAKKATVNLHIERLNTGEYFDKNAVLLAIHPLKIGHVVVAEHFCKYEPPEELFSKNETAMAKLRDELEPRLRNVGTYEGITVTCNKTECIFEFVVYVFQGHYPEQPCPEAHRQHVLAQGGHQPNGFPEGDVPFPYPPPFPMAGDRAGSIAIVLPINMFPQQLLGAADIEQFLAGDSALQLSAHGSGPPLRFVLTSHQNNAEDVPGGRPNSSLRRTGGQASVEHVSAECHPMDPPSDSLRDNRVLEVVNRQRSNGLSRSVSDENSSSDSLGSHRDLEVVNLSRSVSNGDVFHDRSNGQPKQNGLEDSTLV